MSAIAWTTIENAIHAAVVAGSGLLAAQVIWSYQEGPRPDPPYIALSLSAVRTIGQDWRVREDAPDPQPGAEIQFRYRGPRVVVLSLQCFGGGASGEGGGASGEGGALARLHDTLAALTVNADALNIAGVGIGVINDATLVAGRINTLLEPRAVASVELHVASELLTTTGLIEHVQAVVEAGDDIDIEEWIPDPPP